MRRYYVTVVLSYVLVLTYLLFFTETSFYLNAPAQHTFSLLTIGIGSIGAFLILKPSPRNTARTLSTCVGIFFFALTEEILFRAIIQSQLFAYFESHALSIFVSATVFGLAHILNDAKGFHPRNWNWKLVQLTFLAGLPLGLLFAVSGSIWYAVVLHGVLLGMYRERGG